ncbi:MAG: 50S ribosomal protein L25 [Spirochaetota bacterium]
MSQSTVIKGKQRDTLGSAPAKRLRREGRIPAVIYGKDKPIHISLDAKEFNAAVPSLSESNIITIKIGRKSHSVLVKDYQEILLSTDLAHIDFFELTKGEAVHTQVPFVLEGAAPGVREGGILEQVLHEVDVEAMPEDLPGHITVNIDGLQLNESIHIGDIEPPKGVKFLIDEDRTIATVTSIREEPEEEAEGEEEEEVEVIGEASEETEEEEE